MVTRQKILITGSNGQLGQALKKLSARFPLFEYIFLGKEELAVDESDSVNMAFQKYHPQYCINCAAYTAVDKAESETELAFRINATAVQLLAAASYEFNTRFIHISTDYVFDGLATTPYLHDSPVNPQAVYGASKLEGERLAIKANAESLIIRTSWVYSEFGKNFVKTMLRLMSEKESLNVVSDQRGSPTYAPDLAEAILQIISRQQWHAGIYQYSNSGVISWYDFAVAIQQMTAKNCRVNPIPSSQYPTPAKRPSYSALDTRRIHADFGIEIKPWKESLEVCLQELSANVP
jgi:dTDP-4-dehydrorhamnose reductase